MANINGSFDFPSSLNVVAEAPLDTRMLVPTFDDLISENNWNLKTHPPYNGMLVITADTGDVYILINKDKLRDVTSWKKLGNDSLTWIVLK